MMAHGLDIERRQDGASAPIGAACRIQPHATRRQNVAPAVGLTAVLATTAVVLLQPRPATAERHISSYLR